MQHEAYNICGNKVAKKYKEQKRKIEIHCCDVFILFAKLYI